MSNNAEIPSNLAPATKVGGMRVKAPDAHRTPLEDKHEKKEGSEDEDTEEEEEQERMRKRALEERQAQDMQNHTASHQKDISKNTGQNPRQQVTNPSVQPRSMNH